MKPESNYGEPLTTRVADPVEDGNLESPCFYATLGFMLFGDQTILGQILMNLLGGEVGHIY